MNNAPKKRYTARQPNGCPSILPIGARTKRTHYSPQFSALAAISVRRFAWALGLSMPKAVDLMSKLLPTFVDKAKVCQSCKDSTKCQGCTFNSQPTEKELSVLVAVL